MMKCTQQTKQNGLGWAAGTFGNIYGRAFLVARPVQKQGIKLSTCSLLNGAATRVIQYDPAYI